MTLSALTNNLDPFIPCASLYVFDLLFLIILIKNNPILELILFLFVLQWKRPSSMDLQVNSAQKLIFEERKYWEHEPMKWHILNYYYYLFISKAQYSTSMSSTAGRLIRIMQNMNPKAAERHRPGKTCSDFWQPVNTSTSLTPGADFTLCNMVSFHARRSTGELRSVTAKSKSSFPPPKDIPIVSSLTPSLTPGDVSGKSRQQLPICWLHITYILCLQLVIQKLINLSLLTPSIQYLLLLSLRNLCNLWGSQLSSSEVSVWSHHLLLAFSDGLYPPPTSEPHRM